MFKWDNRTPGVKLVLILALIFSESACSSLDTFAVLNKTNAPMRLEYTLKARTSDDPQLRESLGFVATVAADKAGEVDCPWQSLSSTEYSYDQATRRIIVQVPPGTALRIARLTNYVETDERAAEEFPISSIMIDGTHGLLRADGQEARLQFKNWKRSLHAIVYE